jgi:hypothetical protein
MRRKSVIETEEQRWADAMAGMTPQQRDAYMAECLQRAKDQFCAMAAKRPQRADGSKHKGKPRVRNVVHIVW